MAQAGVKYTVGPRIRQRNMASPWPACASELRCISFWCRFAHAMRTASCCPKSPTAQRRAGVGGQESAGVQLPHDSVGRSGEPGALPEAARLRSAPLRTCSPACWQAMTKKLGPRSAVMHEVVLIAPIPNHKADFNNQGAFSTDYIGESWDYPDGDLRTARRDLAGPRQLHRRASSIFWRMTRACRKPLQEEMNRWGLAKDEFLDTENWPHQLYIREARRMVGEFVMTQKDLQTDLTKPDPIGMGSYNSDSHNVQRIVNAGRLRGKRRRHAGGREAVPDSVPRDAAEARPRRRICWCRSAFRRATWRIHRCAWSRST